jgi:hypothetical protein
MRVLVITSCTGEKSVKTEHQLTPDDFAQGADHIAQRERSLQPHMTRAEELYTGQQHKRLMSGVHAFRGSTATTGHDLDLWILSAGYGLIPGDRPLAPYECTFSGMPKANAREWSTNRGIPDTFRRLVSVPYDLGIVLLGGAYLDAVQLTQDIRLGGPTLFLTGQSSARVLRSIPNAHLLELTKEDTRRFHAGLVSLKGEVAGRLLAHIAGGGDTSLGHFDPDTLLDHLASLPSPLKRDAKPKRSVVANPDVDQVIALPEYWYARSHRSQLRYYVPDWDDRVDPFYNFEDETHAGDVADWSNETYAHQLYGEPITDGILVSRATVDQGRRKRELVEELGVHRFLRVPNEFPVLGDCGAFSYVKDDVPPYTTEDVLDYYTRLGFNMGVSVDHLVFADTEEERYARYDLTIHNAEAFLTEHKARGLEWEPLGAVQGWDAQSYADAARQYVAMGYGYLALGGLVRSSDKVILNVLEAVHEVVPASVKIHLLGIARFGAMREFVKLGVSSIDSASPLRRAWLGSDSNYLTPNGWYPAIRIPDAKASFRAMRLVRDGAYSAETLERLERESLRGVREFAADLTLDVPSETLLDTLVEYDQAFAGERKQTRERLRYTLEDRPWEQCGCAICSRWGIEVLIFRGNNRNRRRGFHNTKVFYDLLPALLEDHLPSWVRPAPRTINVATQLALVET